MILPLITPLDGEVYNLVQMVRWRMTGKDKCVITWANNTKTEFEGEAARFIHAELVFQLNTFRAMQKAAVEPSSIIVPVNNQVQ
jgi:hypothetical protein